MSTHNPELRPPTSDLRPPLDITGELCPMTWVKVKLSLEQLQTGEVLEVLLRGEEPLRNVPRSATEDGHKVLATVPAGDGNFRLTIQAVHT